MGNSFGKLLKELRLKKGLTLREFCVANKIDPGNYSRLERGRFPAPQKEQILERYAVAFGLLRGSDEWLEFFDIAAASRGELPKDLLSDDEVLKKLPVVFRTLRGSPISPEKMDALVEEIRRS
jgi:transcriptional regulator with XRE-family HTH domain